jgi:hypothetical protein
VWSSAGLVACTEATHDHDAGQVEELIDRAQAVRVWLKTATGCDCASLDVCALFGEDPGLPPQVLLVNNS